MVAFFPFAGSPGLISRRPSSWNRIEHLTQTPKVCLHPPAPDIMLVAVQVVCMHCPCTVSAPPALRATSTISCTFCTPHLSWTHPRRGIFRHSPKEGSRSRQLVPTCRLRCCWGKGGTKSKSGSPHQRYREQVGTHCRLRLAL